MEAKPHANQPPLPTKNLCKLVEILLRNARRKRERQNICYEDTLNPNASGSEAALQTPPEKSSTNSVPGDGVGFPTVDLEARSSEHEEVAKLRFKGKTPSQVNLTELTKEFRALTVAQERESRRQKEPVAGSVIPSEWHHKKVKCGDAELSDLAPSAVSLTQQPAEASHGLLRGNLGVQNLSLRMSPPETKMTLDQTTPVQFTGGGYPSSSEVRLQDATARGSFSEELRTKTTMAQQTPSAAQYIGTPLLMTTAPKMQLVWVKAANNQMVLAQVPVASMPSSGTVVSGQPPISSNLSAATAATATALASPEKVSWASMAASMAAVPPMEYKQMMGERLYPFIQRMYPDLAGKITGMLLEQDNKELLGLLASPDLLKKRVEEAVQVLKDGLCQGKQPLTPDLLAPFPSHVQKQILEEHLFRQIHSLHSKRIVARKITYMLLEMDNKKLLHLLKKPELLKSEVEKTITTLYDALLETSSLREDAEKMSLPVDELVTHSPSPDVLKTRSPSPDVTGAKMQAGDASGRKMVTDDVLEALLMTWEASGSQPLTKDVPGTTPPGEDISRMSPRTNSPTLPGTHLLFDTIMGEKSVTSEFPGTNGLKSPTENISGTQSQAEDVLGLKSLTERVAGIESLGQGISEKQSSSEDVLDRRSPSQNVSGTELLTDDVLGLKSLARNVSKTLSVNEGVEEKKVSIEDIPQKQPLTENMLASLSAELQKKELRDRLLPLIERMHPQLCTEITALLLPLDNSSLLAMLDSHSLLETKVKEAVAVLQAQRTQQLLYLQQQKQILGQRLFTIIQPAYPQLAAHITGFLLEMDFNELLTMLQVPDLLTQRVDQAVKTLQVHLVKDPLTADVLALFPAHVQKQILADRLLPRVQNYYPTLAGEIVRTLLASESWQLLQMLQYPLVLHATADHIVRLMQAKGDAGPQASETAETKDPTPQLGREKDAHQTNEGETASSDPENDHPDKEGLGNDGQNVVHTPINQPAVDVEQKQNETVSETGNESRHLSDMSTNLTHTNLESSTQQNAQVTGQSYSKFTPDDDMNVATDDAGLTERNDSKVQQEAENATTSDHVHATSKKDMQSDTVITDTLTSSTQEGVVRLTPGDLMQSGMFAHHGMLPSTDVFTTVAYLQNQKQILGQRLFTIIQPAYPQLAAHITGFLLEMDYSELLTILQVPDLLTQRVDQAVRTLQAHLVKDPLTADVLALFPAAIQRQILGERLFSQIAKLHPELASKITGMLLALDSKELIDMLQSPHALKGRVDEAIAVLIAYSAQGGHAKELAGVETPPDQHETTADASKLPTQKPDDLKESRKPAEDARGVEEDLSSATAGQRGFENEELSASPNHSVKLSDIDEACIDALANPSKVEMDVRGTLETDVVFMEENEKELLLDV